MLLLNVSSPWKYCSLKCLSVTFLQQCSSKNGMIFWHNPYCIIQCTIGMCGNFNIWLHLKNNHIMEASWMQFEQHVSDGSIDGKSNCMMTFTLLLFSTQAFNLRVSFIAQNPEHLMTTIYQLVSARRRNSIANALDLRLSCTNPPT